MAVRTSKVRHSASIYLVRELSVYFANSDDVDSVKECVTYATSRPMSDPSSRVVDYVGNEKSHGDPAF